MSAVFVFKAIKPKRLKVDAYRLEILNELRKEGTTHRRILARTVTTWKNPPKFESIIGLDREGASVLTGPTGNQEAVQHWVWTDLGTRAHTISARRAPNLIFQSGYTAATQVGKYTSRKARRHGAWNRRKSVRHPGTEARGWSARLTKERQRPFEERMKAAMRRAANKSF